MHDTSSSYPNFLETSPSRASGYPLCFLGGGCCPEIAPYIPCIPPPRPRHVISQCTSGTHGTLLSPLQEHRLQQEAFSRRAGRTLSPHVLFYIASQVLGMEEHSLG